VFLDSAAGLAAGPKVLESVAETEVKYQYVSLGVGFSWLATILLAAWWAGFMPFPTSPKEIGTWQIGPWKDIRSMHMVLISADEAREKAKQRKQRLGEVDCDSGIGSEKFDCYLFDVQEKPFFGWATPRWMLLAAPEHGEPAVLELYGTYAACQWSVTRAQRRAEANWMSTRRLAAELHKELGPDNGSFFCMKMPK
jgi:hypothetical protein